MESMLVMSMVLRMVDGFLYTEAASKVLLNFMAMYSMEHEGNFGGTVNLIEDGGTSIVGIYWWSFKYKLAFS